MHGAYGACFQQWGCPQLLSEGLTGLTNEVCARERGAGEGSLCPDLLGVPQPAWGW